MEQIVLNEMVFTSENLDEIVHLGEDELSQETRSGIRNFLEEWWNDSDFIEANTSGSTGAPKTIRLEKSTVAGSADKTIRFFGLNSSATGLLCLPCRYIAGKLMLVRAIRSQMPLRIVEPATDVLNNFVNKVHFAAMIPSQVASAIKETETRQAFHSIDKVLIGGGPVDSELEEQLQQFSNSIYHSYGMTETATHVALRNISKRENHYTALPGVRFSLDDRSCLVIEVDHLKQKVVTNDIVDLTDEFRFQWLGRADHAIISGGLKFLPEVLEKKISPVLSVPYYITGIADSKLGQRIVLVIEGDTWSEDRLESLFTEFRNFLESYEVPKEVRFLKEFPKTPSGKMKRISTF